MITEFIKQVLLFFGISLVWLYLCIVVLQLFAGYYKGPFENVTIASTLAVAWTFFCCLTSIGIIQRKINIKLLEAITIIVFIFFMFVLMTDNLMGLISTIINKAGIGEMPVRLVVSTQGCKIINRATPYAPICETNQENNVSLICPTMLRSKIGTPYVIELLPFNENDGWRNRKPSKTISIPKSEVLSWSRIDILKDQKQQNPHESFPSRPATHLNTVGLSEHQKKWLNSQCG